MKKNKWRYILGIYLVMSANMVGYGQTSATSSNQWPFLEGEYLGQEKPGLSPEIFAEGLISKSTNHEFGVAFNPDGSEFYFTRREPGQMNKLYMTKRNDTRWLEPVQIMPQLLRASEPHISPDGQQLFFGTREGLRMSKKSGSEWSNPTIIGNGMYVTTTNQGTIYYTNKEQWPPFVVKRTYGNGSLSKEIPVSIKDLKGRDSSHPFIDPEERYLIFNISGDLHISMKEDAGWSSPSRLNNEINSSEYEFAPYVSSDGKYFFFSRGDEERTNIYWVEAEVLFNR